MHQISQCSSSKFTSNSDSGMSKLEQLLANPRLFQPIGYGLPEDFLLTNYMHGRELLKVSTIAKRFSDTDYCLLRLRNGTYSLRCTVHTTVKVDDPFIYGQIACVNMLGKMHAIGLTTCDSVWPLAEMSIFLPEDIQLLVAEKMMGGFMLKMMEIASETNCAPYYIIRKQFCSFGGALATICRTPSELIGQTNVKPNDVIMLTKPLGLPFALALHQSMKEHDMTWCRAKKFLTEQDMDWTYQTALNYMRFPDKIAAMLMHKYGAHGAIHVGHRGILGHMRQLAKIQPRRLRFYLYTLPILGLLADVAKATGDPFRLLKGTSPEVSGGLVICLPWEAGQAFIADFTELQTHRPWIIGTVVSGGRTATMGTPPTRKILRVTEGPGLKPSPA